MTTPDDPRARAEARIGAVLNEKWTLERLIGLGGMAAVYAGRHRNGARGAVKLLHPELAKLPEVRERFTREGYAANKVDHPNAVRVLDDDVVKGGPDDGSAYIIMELLEGTSLEDRIHDGGPFTPEEVLAIADDVLDVLAAAHAHGVIHRDLKPENLMLESGEGPFGFARVKVLDFGLARLAHGEVVTRAGMALGTPSYMAPEQAAGKSESIDGRSDLFGLGAIMFRLLTGRRVHEAAHVVELVAKMAHEPAPTIRSVDPEVPENIAAIVDRALRFRREDRYPSAAVMRNDVRAARDGRPLPSLASAIDAMGSEPTEVARAPVAAVVAAPAAVTPRPVARKPRRVGVIVSVVWVLVVAAIGAIVIGVMRSGKVSESLPAASASSESAAPEPSASSSIEEPAQPDAQPDAAADAIDVASDAADASAVAPKPTVKPTIKPKTTTTTKKPVVKKKK